MNPKFAIPKEFESAFRYVEAKDSRSDEEILDSLTKYVPITTEKNIWTFWHAGALAMPGWCQHNVINWVRLCGPSWTIRVLDKVPDSPNNALNWVIKNILPKSYIEGTMDGPYTGPHSVDFLRGACICEYGGAWMDVGCILVRNMDRICWNKLADPKSPLTIAVPWLYDHFIANHFVAGRKDYKAKKDGHDIFMALWEGQDNCSDIHTNPLIQEVIANVKFEDSQARGFTWDFKVSETFVLGYVGQVTAWTRLCMLEEPNGGFNGREYYAEHVMLFDSLSEDWATEQAIGFNGDHLFKILKTRRDTDPESEEYKMAYNVIWRILTESCMQKVTHGKGLTISPHLGALLDMKENEELDIEPGTFAELLRYGSIHFEQTREGIDEYKFEKPEAVIRKRVLEP